LIASLILFLGSFIIRLIALTSHPFILNGVEASIGLDVVNVRDGLSQNPFGTGWLSNPTLLYYLLVWPMRWLGPTSLSIRLLSPLIGALTVVATYLMGTKLWGRETGLLAAILLLGSHFHLHYSRLGMTNVWDPLLTLLSLGLLGIAWQQKGGSSRVTWLAAGIAVGLNAYVFTGSHLLPLMLAALTLFVLLFDRSRLRQNWRHLTAAGAMAFVIALPQLLYYNNNPGIFMERANVLGILDHQSGWLSQETARTGLSRGEVMQDQLIQAFLSFNYSLDKSGSYRPERPLLGYGTAVLFVLGMGSAIFRLRQIRYNLLLVWIIIPIIFAGALLLESPSSHRLIITAPALCILAAVALTEIGRWLQSGLQRRGTATQQAVNTDTSPLATSALRLPILMAVAMLIALLDINFYFVTYRQQHSFADRNTEIADNLAAYLNTLETEWDAYFFGAPNMYVDFPTITFLVTNFQKNVNLFDVEGFNSANIQATTKNKTFVFLPEHSAEIGEVQTQYPDGRLITFPGFHADPLFFAYEVTP
jgi:4-amino-4-deoxy-L-arabinose transferase-like glycosyltransferase